MPTWASVQGGESRGVSEPPVLYLSSREVTNWATPRAGVEPGATVELDAMRHDGIGTLYATREEAEETFAQLADR
jgi:hypothetical protein